MSGKRISKQERRVISKGRRYASRIRENFPEEAFIADKVTREFARLGR